MHTEDSSRDGRAGDDSGSHDASTSPSRGGAYRESGGDTGPDHEAPRPYRGEGREETIINGGALFKQFAQLPVVIMAAGGIFSIGGLYVSFGTMSSTLDKHGSRLERAEGELQSVDLEEVRSLNARVARVEGALIGIDKQLDRIERSLEERR